MQQLTLPGIEFVPSQVRRHGLREFHHYPLVSYGKNAAGIWLRSRRVLPAQAWTYPELELGRTANSIPALLFDIDRPDWGLEIFDGGGAGAELGDVAAGESACPSRVRLGPRPGV